MPSNFSTIGVPVVGSPEAFEEWASRTAQEGVPIAVDRGEYRVLRSEAGAELWAALDRRGRLAAFAPHFAGATRCRARLTDRIERADEARFEGAFDGWAVEAWPTSPAAPDEDVTPLRFDAPDPLLHADLRLPALVSVGIAAFARECQWHRDSAAFQAAQATEPLPFAEEFFAYADVFDEDAAEKSAMAVLSGRVLATAVRVNELTGLGFRWAAVKTLVGEIDVVADPSSSTASRHQTESSSEASGFPAGSPTYAPRPTRHRAGMATKSQVTRRTSRCGVAQSVSCW